MSGAERNGASADMPSDVQVKEVNLIDLDDTPEQTSQTAMSSVNTEQHKKDDAELARKTEDLRVETGLTNEDAAAKSLPATPPPPEPPSAKDKPYLDPAPKTPVLSRQPSVGGSEIEYNEKSEDYDPHQDENRHIEKDVVHSEKEIVKDDNDSNTEIQSIMEQFTGDAASTKDEIMSPRHEMPNPLAGSSAGYPTRLSSLEPIRSRDMDSVAQSPINTTSEKSLSSPPPVPPKPDFGQFSSPLQSQRAGSTTSLPHVLPDPEPEPELPFDFHRFLEQLRHKSADPVAKFLRSFLTEFGKKQWAVHEQVKIIGDFLIFIASKMAQCDVWREVSDNEFDNAKEGMEKLVMNRLYSQTFSPVIPPPPQQPARSRSRGKQKELEKILGPGRRGQHQEDVERDEVLAQKIRIYSWVKEEHLDIASVGPNGERFLRLAQQELMKIKNYRAPRDKVICILNCCKVIFGLLKNAQSSDTSADSFVPLLIFVVLQANPEHLVSNIQYILRFRNQDKLSGEAGYYLSSLSGAVQFIESLDRTTLTVSDDEFEKHVELAVSAIAEQNREAEAMSPRRRLTEKSALSEAEVTPRNSMEVTSTSPRKSRIREPRSGPSISDGSEDGPAVTGLLKSIQRPLSTIGRMFSDQDVAEGDRSNTGLSPPKLGPSVLEKSRQGSVTGQQVSGESLGTQIRSYDAQEAAARQASAEVAEARRIQRAEHRTIVETLCGMFPNLDRDIIDDVVRQKQGRVGLAVDACLSLTAGV